MLTIPPFCPNAACKYHHPDSIPSSSRKKWYRKDGTYQPKHSSTPIQRFVCTGCGCRFSAQTFSLDYGVKTHLPYRRCLAGVEWISQRMVPATAPRTLNNDLFAVNYFDREIRKDQSNHTRETVQFSRDVNNAMDRLLPVSVERVLSL